MVLADLGLGVHLGGMNRRPTVPAQPIRVVFLTFPDGQILDFSGPLEIFARATRWLRDEARAHPGYETRVVAENAGPIRGSSGFRFLPDATLRSWRDPIDTLLVSGGRGVHRTLTHA